MVILFDDAEEENGWGSKIGAWREFSIRLATALFIGVLPTGNAWYRLRYMVAM